MQEVLLSTSAHTLVILDIGKKLVIILFIYIILMNIFLTSTFYEYTILILFVMTKKLVLFSITTAIILIQNNEV